PVGPPAGRAIDRPGLIRRKHGKRRLLAQRAAALVQMPLVAEHKPPLETAFRAERRRRNFDFLVECEIRRLDRELLAALLAAPLLGIHAFRIAYRKISSDFDKME